MRNIKQTRTRAIHRLKVIFVLMLSFILSMQSGFMQLAALDIAEWGPPSILKYDESVEDTYIDDFDNLILNVDEVSTRDIMISSFSIATSDGRSEFLVGETITIYVTLEVTGDGSPVSGSVVEIIIPGEFVNGRSLVASDINAASSKTVAEVDGNWVITYTLNPLASGVALSVPISFKANQRTTPKNSVINVTANLKDLNDNQLLPSVNEEFLNLTNELRTTKMIKNATDWSNTENNPGILGGKEDPSNPGHLSADIGDTLPITFSYNIEEISSAGNGGVGQRYYEKFVIKDKIPDGAVFLAGDNPDWEYDDNSRIATYTYIVSGKDGVLGVEFRPITALKLRFPGAPFGETIINSVDIEAFPKDVGPGESNVIASDTIGFSLSENKPPETIGIDKKAVGRPISNFPFRPGYYDTVAERNKIYEWELSTQNVANPEIHGNLKMINVVMTDFKLDSALKYTAIEFMPTFASEGNVRIEVVHSDGSVEVLKEAVNPANGDRILLPDNIQRFKVSFNEGTYLSPGKTFKFKLETELIDKVNDVLKPTDASKDMYNFLNVKGGYEGTELYDLEDRDRITWVQYDPSVYITKKVTNAKTEFLINEQVRYEVELSGYGFLANEQKVETTEIIDILPEGIEYVPGSGKLSVFSSSVVTDTLLGSVDPQIVKNYHDTGRTALVWEIEPISISGADGDIIKVSRMIKASYEAKVTGYATIGKNTNDAFILYDNIDEISLKNSRDDIFDLNGDGSTSDKLLGASAYINYAPPRELIALKQVKGNLDSVYLLPPNVGTSEIGTTVEYRLSIYNNSVSDIPEVYLLDLFPKVGDKSVSVDAASNPPGRVNRGSTFPITLNGPIKSPVNWEVQYTTEAPGDDIKSFFDNEAIWFTALSDYSQATAFKITMTNGEILEVSERVEFFASFDIPKEVDMKEVDKAVNSFGIALNSSLSFFESNNSTVEIIKYDVVGHVFNDFDENGLFEQDEMVFKNHLVELVDAAGNPVLDWNGNPIQATTDVDGHYEIGVYTSGEYRVRILPPSTSWNSTISGIEENSSHILESNMTDVFILNEDNPSEVKNAGFYNNESELHIYKKLEDADGDKLENSGKFFDFTVTIEGEPYNGQAKLVNTLDDLDVNIVEISGGNVVIPADYMLVIQGLPKGHNYKVVEIITGGYVVTPTDGVYKGILDNATVTLEYVNKIIIEKTEVTGTKEWVNGPTARPDVELQLYQNGTAYGESAVVNADNSWSYTWPNLDLTDKEGNAYTYTVDEVSVPDGYEKEISQDGLTVTNTFIEDDELILINYYDCYGIIIDQEWVKPGDAGSYKKGGLSYNDNNVTGNYRPTDVYPNNCDGDFVIPNTGI